MIKYDIVQINDIICCYIGKRKNGATCFETILNSKDEANERGVYMPPHYFPKYKPVLHRRYWGYYGLIREAKLLEKRNGKRPTFNYIKKKFGNNENTNPTSQ